MKKLIIVCTMLLVLVGCAGLFLGHNKTEAEIKASALLLTGSLGGCSGEEIKAPSGKEYVITAGHCLHVAPEGVFQATSETGEVRSLKVIAEDPTSDLLLLEPFPGVPALSIAKDIHMGQELRTFTHGGGRPTFKTEGVVLGLEDVTLEYEILQSKESMDHCLKNTPKFIVMEDGILARCIMSTIDVKTDALVIPGSSGGMAVDSHGELIGVVSAMDRESGFLVSLDNIKAFLATR